MSRKCIVCEVEIDPRRINILPSTQTCTQHSTVEKKAARTDFVLSIALMIDSFVSGLALGMVYIWLSSVFF